MAHFHLDKNVAAGLARAWATAGHNVTTASALQLDRALDAEHLHYAATRGRILVTHDQGFPALHEAWLVWLVAHRQVAPHPGIIQLGRYGNHDAAVATAIHEPLAQGWNPTGTLWLFNLRLGWKRLEPRRIWSAWVASPLDLP